MNTYKYSMSIATALIAQALIAGGVRAMALPAQISPPGLMRDHPSSFTHEQLIEELLKQIELEPYNHENYVWLGLAYEEVEDYANELEALKKQVAYLPNDIMNKDIYFGNLARAYMINDKWEEGKIWLDKADQANPENVYNRWLAYDYYLRSDLPKKAAAQLKKLHRISPTDQDVYYEGLMKTLEFYENPGDAVKLFEFAAKADRKNPKAHRALGIAVRFLPMEDYEGNMPRVIKSLNTALALDPEYIPTYISIADTYFLLGEKTNEPAAYDQAIEWFERGRAIDPENMRLAYMMGYVYYRMKQYDLAIERLEFAYQKAPHADEVQRVLAHAYNAKAYECYLLGENLDEGLVIIEQALALRPDDGIIMSTKAELFYKLARYEEAYDLIRQSIALIPDNKEIQKDLVMIERALGIDSKTETGTKVSDDEPKGQ